MRVWQCGSIENSYDVGMVIKKKADGTGKDTGRSMHR